MLPLLLLIVFASVVTVQGCVGDDAFDWNAPIGPIFERRDATSADLQDLVFQFDDGGAFDVNPRPAGSPAQGVTLTFGDFEDDGDGDPNTGPFTLESEGGTAGGSVTLGSCIFSFSDFSPEEVERPQADDVIIMDPCHIFDNLGILEVTNMETGISSTSAIPTPVAESGVPLARINSSMYP